MNKADDIEIFSFLCFISIKRNKYTLKMHTIENLLNQTYVINLHRMNVQNCE